MRGFPIHGASLGGLLGVVLVILALCLVWAGVVWLLGAIELALGSLQSRVRAGLYYLVWRRRP